MDKTNRIATDAENGLLSIQQQTNNIWRLALAQALSGANAIVIYATGAVVGNSLAPSPILATLPITIFVIGMAVCVFPAGELARLYGRKFVFLVGTGAGTLAGIVATYAVYYDQFWLFCSSTFLGGAYAAVVLSFRFAVTDGVPESRKPQALSLVMAGGILAGVIGPQLVTWTMDLWADYHFAATFIAQAIVAAMSAFILIGVRIQKEIAPATAQGKGRDFKVIVTQPLFVCAVISGASAYMIMNFLMTAAPLAMHVEGHSQASSNLAIQWHVIAMYGPSFFTGKIISRFGASTIAFSGIILTGLSAIVGLDGTSVSHFWAMLILLGIGWNFGFLGASAK
ncbi:MFS transporter [Vibrio viridaestus]|uniref:MFS transporter n=1 Tax=Vibrio viridaestus TaxID=2487322 RepID=UPI001FB82042|nr:MFS transporter [Vibrio viridaestus]